MYNYSGSGGITVESSPFFPTGESAVLFFDQQLSWDVVGTVEKDLDFVWDVGSTGLYWFRVQCKCLDSEDAIESTSFSDDDAACGNAPPAGQAMFKIVAAQNIADLCQKLSEVGVGGPFRCPIEKIERFTRPVETERIRELEEAGVDLSRNELVEVPFRDVEECIGFAVDNELVEQLAFSMTVVNTFFVFEASGGLLLGGSAEFVANEYELQGSGGLTFGGEADVSSTYWSHTPDSFGDDLLVSGESGIVFSDWNYVGNGDLVISGESNITSPSWSWQGSGGLVVSGEVSTEYRVSWAPLFPQITIGGGSFAHVVNHFGSGGLIIGGTGNGLSSYYAFTGSDGITLGGTSTVVSPYFSWIATGGIVLGGVSPIGRSYESFGGASLGGSASQEWIKELEGNDGILISGSSNIVSSAFSWVGLGGITVQGSVDVNFIDTSTANFGASMDLLELGVDFEVEDAPDLTIGTGTVTTECGCGPLPLSLNIKHNFNQSHYLSEFLRRSGNLLPDNVVATFRTARDSWQSNFHFSGIGNETNTVEKWDIVFEFSCADSVGGVDLQSVIWKFCALFRRRNLTTGEDYDSKLVFTFPIEDVCVTGILRNIDFGFIYDTQFGTVLTNNGSASDTTVVHDNIGLFDSFFWINNPDLKINISTSDLSADTTRVDITPILPFDPTAPLAIQDATLGSA